MRTFTSARSLASILVGVLVLAFTSGRPTPMRVSELFLAWSLEIVPVGFLGTPVRFLVLLSPSAWSLGSFPAVSHVLTMSLSYMGSLLRRIWACQCRSLPCSCSR